MELNRMASPPVELDLAHVPAGYIYRLWTTERRCLYVGRTRRHPWIRIREHQEQPWWNKVEAADYLEVYDDCDIALLETAFIESLDPVHNIYPGQGRKRVSAKNTEARKGQILDLICWLDDLKVPQTWGRPAIRKFMQENHGPKVSTTTLAEAIYHYKNGTDWRGI